MYWIDDIECIMDPDFFIILLGVLPPEIIGKPGTYLLRILRITELED